ncbi:hypothetical protein [Corynebacterium sp. Marseille-Q2516]
MSFFDVVDRVTDRIYPLFVYSMIAGALGTAIGALTHPPASFAAPGPLARWFAAVLIAAVYVFMAQRLAPLVGITEEDWVWKLRGSDRLPRWDRVSAVQWVAASVVGAALGACAGWSITASVVSGAVVGAARVGYGWACARHWRVAHLLEAGRRRFLVTHFFSFQDSELVSDALAVAWQGARPPRTCGAPVAVSRLLRRYYLVLIAVVVALWSWALAPAYGGYGLTVAAGAWVLLAPAWFRVGDFTRLVDSSPERWVLLGAHSVVGVLLLLVAGMGALGIAISVVAWWYAGIVRGRPRVVSDLTVMDTGQGLSVSPEIVGYYVRGLWPVAAVLWVAAR